MKTTIELNQLEIETAILEYVMGPGAKPGTSTVVRIKRLDPGYNEDPKYSASIDVYTTSPARKPKGDFRDE